MYFLPIGQRCGRRVHRFSCREGGVDEREHRRGTILATAVAITLWILSALPTLLVALL